MAHGVRLHVHGPYACFTRPEMKVERVSYDVMTPSAARGILEAIHWKPAIRWVIDAIHVLNPIEFTSVRRNEVEVKTGMSLVNSAMKSGILPQLVADDNRQQRAGMLLQKVAYIIEAHFELTEKAGPGDNPGKHLDTFNRRAAKGKCFHQPCLGCREFPAYFTLLPSEEPLPASQIKGEIDLGWMLYDIDFSNGMAPIFYRPLMRNGVIDVRAARREEA